MAIWWLAVKGVLFFLLVLGVFEGGEMEGNGGGIMGV